MPNRENPRELVHEIKLIRNASSKICQIIQYFFEVFIHQIHSELSSLQKQIQGHEGICLTNDFSVLPQIFNTVTGGVNQYDFNTFFMKHWVVN